MDNDTILNNRMNTYNQITGPRVGDWIREHSGRMTRATHDWTGYEENPTMQHGGGEFGRFYLGDGYISYSGGLDTGIKKADLIQTDEIKLGSVWFFKNNFPMVKNGIDYMVDFRVYEVAQMPPFDNIHDKVLIPFKSGTGGHAVEEFEQYLFDEDKRVKEENDYELSHYQYDNFTMLDVLNIEYMDNVEIASYQWYRDNPGWWQD